MKLKKESSFLKKNTLLTKKYLNAIAFLFKNDSYKSENEVRLVVNGFEFAKQYNTDISPPKVYIELASIKEITKKIILGPNVEDSTEWKTVIFHSFVRNIPVIEKSTLRYKYQ